MIRALFFILDVGNRAKPPKKSTEERRQYNLELGRPRNAGLPWAEEDRATVKSRFLAGATIEKLAAELERSSAAIVAEIIRQDLVPPSLR